MKNILVQKSTGKLFILAKVYNDTLVSVYEVEKIELFHKVISYEYNNGIKILNQYNKADKFYFYNDIELILFESKSFSRLEVEAEFVLPISQKELYLNNSNAIYKEMLETVNY